MSPRLILQVLLLTAAVLSIAKANDANIGELKRSLAPKVPFSQFPFAALILGTGSDNSIEYVCSGSILDKKSPQSHILTTAFCIQDRQDSTGAPVKYSVLIEDAKGNVTLGSSTFSQFEVDKTFMHPNATKIAEFSFTSAYPNGTKTNFNVAVAPNDVGILRLKKSLKDLAGVTPVELSKTIPTAGTGIIFVGYGGPQFFSLGATTGTEVISSNELQGASQTANGKLIFINDVRPNIPANQTQSVEPGDEGSPMLDASKKQVGIVIGSWQVNPNTTEVMTFATLGPAISPNIDYINSIINEQKVKTSGSGQLLVNFAALLVILASLIL